MPSFRFRPAAVLALLVIVAACDRAASVLFPPDEPDYATESAVGVDRVVLAVDSAAVGMGRELRLKAAALGPTGDTLTGAAIRWRSLDSLTFRVSGSGLITPVAPGRKRVVAFSEGKADTAWIRVIPVFDRLAITLDSLQLVRGRTEQLVAKGLDSANAIVSGVPITWRSLDTTVVQVSPIGVLTGIRPGRKRVVAFSSGKADTAWIRVVEPVARVVISPDSGAISVGGQMQFTAVLLDSAGRVLNDNRRPLWRSLDTLTVAVDSNGLAMGLKAGRKAIQARAEGRADSAWIRVYLPEAPVVYDVDVTPRTVNTATGPQTITLTATAAEASGIDFISFVSNGPIGNCVANPSGAPTVYTGSCTFTFPRWQSGAYTNPSISVYAVDGSVTTVTAPDFTVINSAPVYIRNVVISDTIVATATGDATVDVTMDAISAGGIDWAQLSLNTPSRMCTVDPGVAAPDSLRATCRFTFPRWENRSWPVVLRAWGHSGDATLHAGDLTITSAAPVSVSITGVSSRSINTATGARTVTISASASSIAGIGEIFIAAGGSGDLQCRITPTDAPSTVNDSCTISFYQGSSGTFNVNATVTARNGAMEFANGGQIVVTSN